MSGLPPSERDAGGARLEYLGGRAARAQPDPSALEAADRRRWYGGAARFIGIGAAALIVIGMALAVGDWLVRNMEMRALMATMEESEAAMATVQDDVRSIVLGVGLTGEPSDADLLQLNTDLAAVALDGRDSVAVAGRAVEAVTVLPWHGEISEARDAYLAHNLAWQAYLSAAAELPTEFGRPQDQVNSTFDEAGPLIREAVPQPALFALPDQVDRVLGSVDQRRP